ncbi:nitrite reductase [Neobacillus sp. D3-1R]|uniref:nitrite reductase n=1 Tax=Neobacillus sp. D3-1R TaxID=3445778 RepID=UPI003FA000A9
MKLFAVTPGFEVGGSIFKPEQLSVLGNVLGDKARIELTNFQQLYVELDEDSDVEMVKEKLKSVGLQIYPVGSYVKSLKTCSFCQGAEVEGLPTALALNDAVAGQEVPAPMHIAYTGCTNACGEPLLQDIGIVKNKEVFDVYVGGNPKTLKAQVGELLIAGVPENKLNDVVQQLINLYKENGKKREKFSKFVGRITIDKVRENAQIVL